MSSRWLCAVATARTRPGASWLTAMPCGSNRSRRDERLPDHRRSPRVDAAGRNGVAARRRRQRRARVSDRRNRVHARHGAIAAVRHVRAQSSHAGRQDASGAGCGHDSSGVPALSLCGYTGGRAARRTRTPQSGSPLDRFPRARAGALRDLLRRLSWRARPGRWSARAAHPESAVVRVGARADDGARRDLPCDQPRLRADAVVRRADSVRRALVPRAVCHPAARRRGATAMTAAARRAVPHGWRTASAFLVGAGTLAVGAGLRWAPARTWPNLLLGDMYFLSLALGGAVFLAMQYLSGAGWSAVLRRVAEAMMSGLPVAAVLLLSVFFGRRTLYLWSGPMMFARMAAMLALWIWLARDLRLTSLRQDRDPAPVHQRRLVRCSALFLVAFAVTFVLASVDWLMSRSPQWSSTVFAVYVFAGL